MGRHALRKPKRHIPNLGAGLMATLAVLITLGVLSACTSGTGSTGFAAKAPSSSAAAPTSMAPVDMTGAHCTIRDGKAQRSCTPGATNPAVTQATIRSTICVSGWTDTVRPPVSVTNKLKAAQMKTYGLDAPMGSVEEDHLISLELGGSPDSPSNLWPEPWTGTPNAHTKDAEETSLKRQVCAGTLSLVEAQKKIVNDWTY